MEVWAFWLLLFCGVFSGKVLGFPNGGVTSACDSMLPGHGSSVRQTTSAPYYISVSSTSFGPGDKIIVTLQANDSSSFKGFLLQTRTVLGDVAVGTFHIIDVNTQGLLCNKILNSSLSQTNPESKKIIRAIWVAPADVGNVEFRATVVQSLNVFWTDVKSQTLISSSHPPPVTSGHVGCGTKKFCFSSPAGCNSDDPSCYFMSSEAEGGDAFKLEMSGLSDGYISIGFSNDMQMGNDDIYICTKNSAGQIEVQHAVSTGRTTPEILPLGDVQNIVTSFNNGIIKCSFTTKNAISTRLKAAGTSYFIFLAVGPSVSGQIRKHSKMPFITNERVNISSYMAVGGTSSTPSIIKAHGALMLIAWMTTGSMGMLFARNVKKASHSLLLGKAVWFQVHWCLMVLTVTETITAFVLAFVAAMGWSSGAEAHAIIGCIVMILSFFQPVIAFLRPSLKNKRRFIFNWFHALNAFIIKVLAVAAIFLGLQMLDNSPNQWMIGTMGGFVGWEALIYIMFEGLHKQVKFEDSHGEIKSEIIMFLTFVCGNLAFLVALLVGIAES
uniref:Putative ferric-chelate reductase 1 n=1 Tax=Crocodylus porosus TaxID=8502 RepID=A0A7M4F7U7_CROPO